jgi:hypothetical protein
MSSNGHISFNPNTLNLVDRIIILRINTEEMQIETLLNETTENTKKLMSKENNNGKVSISLSRLNKKTKERSELSTIKMVEFENYKILELENGTIEVLENESLILPAKPVLRKISSRLNVNILNNNGNPKNTRQLGSHLIRVIQSQNE